MKYLKIFIIIFIYLRTTYVIIHYYFSIIRNIYY